MLPPEQRLARGDRLSALPDALLHAVLSFLPSPDAVRTCVLSRRWRDLWRTAPCVNIDMTQFGISVGSSRSDVRQKWSRFEDFTTNLLLFRSAVPLLDKFRLYSVSGDSLRDVDRWLRRGIRYCPQVLEAQVPSRHSVDDVPFPTLGTCSRRLKRLLLNGLSLDHRFAEQIRSACPVLEELELWNCRVHNVQEITSHSLKRLVMDNVIMDKRNVTKQRLVITAPSLVCLQMNVSYGGYPNGISVHATDSLLEASILLACGGEKFSSEHQRSLLSDLCNVVNLELGGFQTVALLVEESDPFPIFRNMQTLLLQYCFNDKRDLYDKLEALGRFLQNAPCLNKLTLDCCMFGLDRGMDVRKSVTLPNQFRRTFQCRNLKFVKVIYDVSRPVNQLIELLWCIGKTLPNVTIELTSSVVDQSIH